VTLEGGEPSSETRMGPRTEMLSKATQWVSLAARVPWRGRRRGVVTEKSSRVIQWANPGGGAIWWVRI